MLLHFANRTTRTSWPLMCQILFFCTHLQCRKTGTTHTQNPNTQKIISSHRFVLGSTRQSRCTSQTACSQIPVPSFPKVHCRADYLDSPCICFPICKNGYNKNPSLLGSPWGLTELIYAMAQKRGWKTLIKGQVINIRGFGSYTIFATNTQLCFWSMVAVIKIDK